jgi:hypothetical protein
MNRLSRIDDLDAFEAELLIGRVQEPIRLAEAPEMFASQDAVQQKDVLDSILARRLNMGYDHQSFERQKVNENLRLSLLRELYETSFPEGAINIIKKRNRIRIDDDFIQPIDDPQLCWLGVQHYIDFMLLVSSRIGLDVILPTLETSHDYIFRVQLDQRFRAFPTKYAKLGFDPSHRCMFMGTKGQDNVWIAFAPRTSLSTHAEDVPVGTCEGDTYLSTKHYLAFVAFLAFIFHSKSISHIFLEVQYPDISSVAAFKSSTNIL